MIGQWVWILWESKIALSHRQSQSPLTQGWLYRAARDVCLGLREKRKQWTVFFLICYPSRCQWRHLSSWAPNFGDVVAYRPRATLSAKFSPSMPTKAAMVNSAHQRLIHRAQISASFGVSAVRCFCSATHRVRRWSALMEQLRRRQKLTTWVDEICR